MDDANLNPQLLHEIIERVCAGGSLGCGDICSRWKDSHHVQGLPPASSKQLCNNPFIQQQHTATCGGPEHHCVEHGECATKLKNGGVPEKKKRREKSISTWNMESMQLGEQLKLLKSDEAKKARVTRAANFTFYTMAKELL